MAARRLALVLVLLLALCPAGTVAQQKRPPKVELGSIAPLDLPHLLDTYAAGRFDEAVDAVSHAGDKAGRNLRAYWSVVGRQWIDADPAAAAHRRLVAAAFALETEVVRVERGDWGVAAGEIPCVGTCVLDWAQAQLAERGVADPAERAWYLAAAALASGVRDWRYLERAGNPRAQPPLLPGLMDRAVDRFPADATLRLEQALAAGNRYSVTVDGGRQPADLLPANLVRLINAGGRGAAAAPRPSARDVAVNMLSALIDDRSVGAEASLRLGYLLWATSEDANARVHLLRAAEHARDADERYLAEFLLGWIAAARDDPADAIPHLHAALEARPDSQSAAVVVAALTLQQGDAARAYELAQSSLDRRPTDLDPWRVFLYAHHPRLPALMADLRTAVRR